MDSPPVPVPWVKSPPCSMKLGMILWKTLPSYVNFLPFFPMPFSPVQSALKFSVVFGTTSPYKPKVMRPEEPLTEISRQINCLTERKTGQDAYRRACHQSRCQRKPAHVQQDIGQACSRQACDRLTKDVTWLVTLGSEEAVFLPAQCTWSTNRA